MGITCPEGQVGGEASDDGESSARWMLIQMTVG